MLLLYLVSPRREDGGSDADSKANFMISPRSVSSYTPGVMAGIMMQEQTNALKDQQRKNQALENRIKRLAYE